MSQIYFFNKALLKKDIIIAILIIALPFLFYFYDLIPETKVWRTDFFIIHSNFYEDVRTMFWLISVKLLFLFLLAIWFLTCKHWWRYAILVPIIIEIYKFTGFLNEEQQYIDEYEFIHSLPFTIPVIVLLLLLSRKLNYYSLSKSLNNELNTEIEELFNELSHFKSKDYKSVKKELYTLQHRKNTLKKEDYLKQLIVLRDRLVQF